VLLHEDGKTRPVDTIPGTGREGIKDNNGEGECEIYWKHFCKCHEVPPI
jgi:hypothetical protein